MSCLPLHMGAFPACAAGILKNYTPDEVHEGDAFITNHPYLGGSPHAPDMAVLSPIFFHGEWVGFAANLAHKSDIGGPVPGSCWSQAREIYQEGLHVPPIKYVHKFQTSKDIEAMLGANSRTPELVVGDLRGQVGAARLGERRFQEMMERYGKETILQSFEELFALTEAKVRAEIASWPDGVGEGERFVDSDGIELDKPVRLHVRMEKKGDRLLFDFTGCADQTKGPANIRPTIVRAACCYLLTCLVDPALAINYGLARCIEIKVRDGSVVNPIFPAPVNTYNPTVHALVESLARSVEPDHAAQKSRRRLQQPLDHHRRPQQQDRQRLRAVRNLRRRLGRPQRQRRRVGHQRQSIECQDRADRNHRVGIRHPFETVRTDRRLRRSRQRFAAVWASCASTRCSITTRAFRLRSTKHTVAPKGIDGGMRRQDRPLRA